jgi:peptidoglycan/xylan/chitin deacetylase (PgdA/CDA1 family)
MRRRGRLILVMIGALAAFAISLWTAPRWLVPMVAAGSRGARTAETLRRALPALRARGYAVVTLSELASRGPHAGAGEP